MATIKINLNGQRVPFTCFAAGADVCPDIKLNYDNWPSEVIAENIDRVEVWQALMTTIFGQCIEDVSLITYETL